MENSCRLLIDWFEVIIWWLALIIRWVSVSCKLTLRVLFIASVNFTIAVIWLNSIVVSCFLEIHICISVITIACLFIHVRIYLRLYVIISSILLRVWFIISRCKFFFFKVLLFSLLFFYNFLLDVVWRKVIVTTWLHSPFVNLVTEDELSTRVNYQSTSVYCDSVVKNTHESKIVFAHNCYDKVIRLDISFVEFWSLNCNSLFSIDKWF